jgi:catechol O-methyltransferase
MSTTITTTITAQKQEISKEQQMLNYVRENAKPGNIVSVINTIDKFAWDNWMMNIGDVKSKIYINEIKKHNCKSVLELGSYIGYSALVAINAMGKGGKVLAVDPNDETNAIAHQIWQFAGCRGRITLYSSDFTALSNKWKSYEYDCVLLDHKKDLYWNDLMLINEHGWIKSGTVVVADNVIVFGLNDYMKNIEESGLFKDCVLHESLLEYDSKRVDGMHVAVKI